MKTNRNITYATSLNSDIENHLFWYIETRFYDNINGINFLLNIVNAYMGSLIEGKRCVI